MSGAIALTKLVTMGTVSLGPLLRDLARMSLLVSPSLVLFYVLDISWWVRCLLYCSSAILTLTVFRFWSEGDRSVVRELIGLVRSGQGKSVR